MNEHVAIFLHVATIGRYNDVLNEVLNFIFTSNLHNSIRLIQINVVGKDDVSTEIEDSTIEIVKRNDDIKSFEIPTLKSIQAYSINNRDAKILYFNCLGGRYVGPGFEIRRTWRQLLYQYYIDDMSDCLATLAHHDACGIFWHDEPLPHFASNNWWANADYIASLVDPAVFADRVEKQNLDRYGTNWTNAAHKRRHSAEFWIGSGKGVRPASLMNFKSLLLPKTFTGSYPWWDLPGIDWGLLGRIARKRNTPRERLLSSAQIARATARYHLKKGYDRLRSLPAGS